MTKNSSDSADPKPHPMMCERKGCGCKADYDCEPVPGTAYPGWEKEPTARCAEHAKGMIVIRSVQRGRRDPGSKYQ